MRRSGILAKTLAAVAVLTMVVSSAVARDFSPNAYKVAEVTGLGPVTAANSRAFTSISGEIYADAILGTMSIQREFRRALPSIYSYSQTAHYQNRAEVASDAAYADIVACPTTLCAPGSKWVMWDVPFAMRETQRRDDGYHGYNNTVSGFATGISRMLGETSAIGLAIGYDSRKLDARDYHQRLRGDTFHAALYGGTNVGHFFVDGYAGYSHTWNRSERYLELGGDDFAKGKYGDTVLSAGLKASYVWILENDIRITPSVGVDYSYVKTGSFNERRVGANDLGLNVNKAKFHNIAMPVMVSANRTFSSNFLCFRDAPSLWTPEVRGGWVPQFGAKNASTRVQLNNGGAPVGSSYRASSSTLASSYGTVGGGMKLKLADKYIFAIDYDYSLASKYSNHSVTAMYGVSF